MKSRRYRRRSHRGGGYGFGGSILSDTGGANAGNAQWNPDTSQDCAVDAYRGGNGAFAGGALPNNDSLDGRGGNNPIGGRRHKKSHRRKHKSRRGGATMTSTLYATRGGNTGGRRKTKKYRGGQLSTSLNPALIQQAPRTGYTFDGSGVAGTPDPVRA